MRAPFWIVCGVVAATVFVLAIDPVDPGVSLCYTQRLWGFACPGCGMGRGLNALLHLQLVNAWRFNPLTLPVFLFGAGLTVTSLYDLALGTAHYRRWLYFKVGLPLGLLLLALVAVVWIRNLHLY